MQKDSVKSLCLIQQPAIHCSNEKGRR